MRMEEEQFANWRQIEVSTPERPTGLIQRFKPVVTAALTGTAFVVSQISLFLSIQGERRSERQYEEQYSSRVFLSEGTSDRADPKTNKARLTLKVGHTYSVPALARSTSYSNVERDLATG